MKVMIRFLRRLVRDVAGTPAMEWAILLMLVAAVVGFAIFVLGDATSWNDRSQSIPYTRVESPAYLFFTPVDKCIDPFRSIGERVGVRT